MSEKVYDARLGRQAKGGGMTSGSPGPCRSANGGINA
jgi:hypothetical protein